MKAQKISLDNAKKEKLFYFVANVIIYRKSDNKCLILKRDEREKVHPGKYGVCGGKLEWNDLDINNPTRLNGDVIDFENKLEELLKREAFEESGLEIETDLHYINSVAFVRPDETPVILLKFVASYKGGEVVLEKGGFTDYAWVDEEQVKNYDCILGIKEEIEQAIKIMKK